MRLLRPSIFIIALVVFLPCMALAMQSSQYVMQSDSINIGGLNSTSSNYNESDTIGEQATGLSTSTNYSLAAGFQQMQTSYIAISSGGNISLSNINGLTGGTANGQTSWVVLTDNTAGYSLSIQATSSPALKSSNDSFADYAPASTTVPDFTFSVAASASAFGFSPEGTDILPKYKDNGSTCNTGSSDTANACWDGLSTSSKIISQSSSSNQPNGATTTLKVRAFSGSSHIQSSGAYQATITVTALTL